MATIGHLAVGSAIARACALSSETGWRRLRRAAIASSLATAPDLDLALRAFGVPAGDSPAAHRGASHAAILGPGLALTLRLLGASRRDAACYGLALMSHGLTDMLSDSDRGVAVLWPFSVRRRLAAWQPVPSRAATRHALQWRPWARIVILELIVFSPVIAVALWPRHRVTFAR
jgi:membrane-bound metal-dependent hydrolase YbcI (DUF457 family)